MEIELQRWFIKKTCDISLHTGWLNINVHTKIILKNANIMRLFILLINKDDTIHMHGGQTMLKAYFFILKKLLSSWVNEVLHFNDRV